jgi:hypothetical protein
MNSPCLIHLPMIAPAMIGCAVMLPANYPVQKVPAAPVVVRWLTAVNRGELGTGDGDK